jgi:hypothetical protein
LIEPCDSRVRFFVGEGTVLVAGTVVAVVSTAEYPEALLPLIAKEAGVREPRGF